MRGKLSKATLACIAAAAVTLILAAAAWFLLPEQVGMQIGVSGQLQNVMPKPAALALPIVLGALGIGLSANENRRTAGLVLSLIAPVLLVITMLLNH